MYTTARGRDMVFWQSPKTRKQARPQVSTPTARASGVTSLEIVVDTPEMAAKPPPASREHAYSLTAFSRAALVMTLTDESAMAAAAIIGDSSQPNAG